MTRRSPGDGTLFKNSKGYRVAGYVIGGVPHRVSARKRNDAIEKRREMRKDIELPSISS